MDEKFLMSSTKVDILSKISSETIPRPVADARRIVARRRRDRRAVLRDRALARAEAIVRARRCEVRDRAR